MNSPTWFRALIAVLIAATVVILIGLGCWAGVNATRADREHRSRAVEACQSISDSVIRSECIRGAS